MFVAMFCSCASDWLKVLLPMAGFICSPGRRSIRQKRDTSFHGMEGAKHRLEAMSSFWRLLRLGSLTGVQARSAPAVQAVQPLHPRARPNGCGMLLPCRIKTNPHRGAAVERTASGADGVGRREVCEWRRGPWPPIPSCYRPCRTPCRLLYAHALRTEGRHDRPNDCNGPHLGSPAMSGFAPLLGEK